MTSGGGSDVWVLGVWHWLWRDGPTSPVLALLLTLLALFLLESLR